MDRYGLTEEEEQTHLQEYNHALFQNSLSFLDIVWEINIVYGTVVILEDRSDPGRNRIQFQYDKFFRDYVENRLQEGDVAEFQANMSMDVLKTLEEEKTFHVHFRYPDGVWRLHRIVLTPSLDRDGRLFSVYLGALSLHDDEQWEMESYRRQEQFREALVANCYFQFSFDVSAGGMITEEFEARDGSFPIRESTGMAAPVHYSVWVDKWYELYEPEFDRQQGGNIFTVENFKRAFAQNERVLDVEVKQKAQDGSGRLEYMHIFVLLLENPLDRHIHACIIWRDITPFRQGVIERKLGLESKNAELCRSLSQEEQFRQASISGAMMVYNINLTRNLIEDEFYEMVDGKSYAILELVGLRPPCRFDEFCRRWCESKVLEESRETFRKIYNRQYFLDAYHRGEYRLELEFDTEIGRGIPVTLRSTALLVTNSASGDIIAVVSGKDVTAERAEERRKQEALRAACDAANRASAAKSEFLSRMSHDIRTPMNAIIGMTAIASTHLDDRERVADCLAKITVSSKHLLGLINEVLDMSRIESGRIELQEEAFGLPELLENLLTMCKPQIDAKGHELTVSIRGIRNERVIGDSQRIQQVFMNLMGNAIKYTPQGGHIWLSITEKATDRHGVGCYEFIFEDNGIGMSESFRERLFEPFERAEDERARKEQGTGLGMTIVKNIVQLMDGKIDVESRLDRGTKITVSIFLKLQPEDEASYEQFCGLPVLVVDNDPIACDSTCEAISELGMRCEQVLTGKEAVDRLVERQEAGDGFYAVLLDWRMPGMNGVETAREIRRRAGGEIHIVIVSAYDWSDIEQEARAAGVSAFIGKPVFKSRLAYVFNELMGRAGGDEKRSSLEDLEEEDYTGRRALLVEDNDLNAEIAGEILGMMGLEVDRAVNGKEAVDCLAGIEDGYYDIVFMDIQMPIMNGYEAVRAIRALERAYTSRVPILAMSANAFAQDVQEAMASGMNGHIAKPLDLQQLQRMLRKWLAPGHGGHTEE